MLELKKEELYDAFDKMALIEKEIIEYIYPSFKNLYFTRYHYLYDHNDIYKPVCTFNYITKEADLSIFSEKNNKNIETVRISIHILENGKWKSELFSLIY